MPAPVDVNTPLLDESMHKHQQQPPPSPAGAPLQRTKSNLVRLQEGAASCMLHVRCVGKRTEAEVAELFGEFGDVARVHVPYTAGGVNNWALVTFTSPVGLYFALAQAAALLETHGLILSEMDMHRALLSSGEISGVIDAVVDEVDGMNARANHHHDELERVVSAMKPVRCAEYIPPKYTQKHHIWAGYMQSHLRGWRARRWAKMMHLRGSDFPMMRVKQQSLCTEAEVNQLRQSIADFTAPAPPSSLASIEFEDLFSDDEDDGGDPRLKQLPVATIGLDFSDENNELGPVALRYLVSCLEPADRTTAICEINLMSLDLSGSQITGSLRGSALAADTDLDLCGLRALSACRSFVGNGAILHGRPACTLGTLCLANTGLGYRGLELLLVTVGRSLGRLDLGWNQFGDRGAARLAEVLTGSQALEELWMPGCEIGPSGCLALAGMLAEPSCRLRTLDLAENWLAGLDFTARGSCDASGLGALGASLGRSGSVTDLSLRRNSLNEYAARALGEGLADSDGSLRRVDLSYNRLGDSGIAALAPALHRAPKLAVLNLAHCWLYAGAAHVLAGALHDSLELHELELSDNFLGGGTLDAEPAGLDALAETMKRLASSAGQLEWLGLRGCRIGASCAAVLASALPRQNGGSAQGKEREEIAGACGLTELDLSSNWLLSTGWGGSSLLGWSSLCEGLGHSVITQCALVDCQLGEAAAVILADHMGGWSSLHSLDLSRNPLGDAGVSALCGRLCVEVTDARGIPEQMTGFSADGSRVGQANTSLLLRCDGDSERTRTAYHTLTPDWRESFEFRGLGEATDLEMVLVHWGDDGEAVELGSVILGGLSVATAPGGEDRRRWYPFFQKTEQQDLRKWMTSQTVRLDARSGSKHASRPNPHHGLISSSGVVD